MNKLNEFTFGKTPAALYLTRRLNELNDEKLTRMCSVRVKQFNENIHSLVYSDIQPKVVANLLRMLRVEASNIKLEGRVDSNFVSQLLRNVIIGNIKRAMRKTEVVRKIEINNENIHKISRKASYKVHKDFVEYSILGHTAGYLYNDGSFYRTVPVIHEVEDEVTPELLMAKSDRRCARQQKPHMNISINSVESYKPKFDFQPITEAVKSFYEHLRN